MDARSAGPMLGPRGRRFLPAAILAAALLAFPATAAADEQTVSASVPLQLTNFSTSIELPKFNIPGQTLNEVRCTVTAQVHGTIQAESLDESPGELVTRLAAFVRLRRPDNSDLVVANPAVAFTDAVTEYDGVLDYGGTSGVTHADQDGFASETTTFTDADTLAIFTGSGTITLPVVGQGASTASGPGNVIFQFTTLAGAEISCTYVYGGALAVRVTSFSAKRSKQGVSLRWRTASEAGTLGFNVYAEINGKRVRVNRSLIASRGFAGGAAYSWLDRSPAAKRVTRYWLQKVASDGSRVWLGSARVSVSS